MDRWMDMWMNDLAQGKRGRQKLSHSRLGIAPRSRDSAVLTPLLSATDETSFEAGIKVQIHSQDEPPLIDQLGFGVAPGFQTFVSCQEQRVRQDAPQPPGRCLWALSPAQPCSDALLTPTAHLPAAAVGELPGQHAGGADAAWL